MLSNLGVWVLRHDSAGDMELGTLGVEIQALNTDLQRHMYSRGACSPCSSCGGNAADRARLEKVIRSDKVITMPLYKNCSISYAMEQIEIGSRRFWDRYMSSFKRQA